MSRSYLHLPFNLRSEAQKWNFPLGVPGFRFADLNRVRRLMALDRHFLEDLARQDPALGAEFAAWRAGGWRDYPHAKLSELLLRAAPWLSAFIARLLQIEEARAALLRRAEDEKIIFVWKKEFVDRIIYRKPPGAEEIAAMDVTQLEFAYREVVEKVAEEADSSASESGERPVETDPPTTPHAEDPERELAEVTMAVLRRQESARKAANPRWIEKAQHQRAAVEAWVRALAFHPALKTRRQGLTSLKVPGKIDFEHLVETVQPDPLQPELLEGPAETRRFRDGFDLTDKRWTPRQNSQEAHYCLLCHPREKDSCSRGLPVAGLPKQENALGIPLNGCPLQEKISEAHLLKRQGDVIAALAVIMIDNPMVAGTGHRICNDCMKSCIFQKQEPVNIPQIETGILTEVLRLPYGFEILSLLSRWNPLNASRPSPDHYNGKNVLVVGMGPAGYTLSHYLLQHGFGVVGIDGLKIEPLSIQLRGAKRRVPKPIKDIQEITGPLSDRTILGFGGVSEYGITVRWDKNFLDINYLLLMRRKKFRLFDGVRFGGTLTIQDAWELGFDHIAVATGAGKPTLIPLKNNLVRGVRKASDFLMGLQATGNYKRDSLGNLQVSLPAVVIGGGLTAIDTATELQAYYIVQVEKTLLRFERLARRVGKEKLWARFDEEERGTLKTWLRHGRAVRAERAAAQAAGRLPDFARLIEHWGGVTVAYRRRMQEAPAYRLNHEEIVKAFEEGVRFRECLSPVECLTDDKKHLRAVTFERLRPDAKGKLKGTGEIVELPARSLMVAAGTSPNITYEREHPGSFKLDPEGYHFQPHRLVEGPAGLGLEPAGSEDPGAFFSSYRKDGRFITFFGDNHPKYNGNVVKAMASARDGYPEIRRVFEKELANLKPVDQPEREKSWVRFAERLDCSLRARVVDALRLAENIVEVIVHAPMAAKNFQPGQFFRLQNYDAFAEQVEGLKLSMEGVALTGAWVDPKDGLISLIVLEMGGSSRLCALLEPGEEIVLMGPTGAPTEIPENETVMLAGGGLGNAVLFSIAKALKARHNRVVYFAAYKNQGLMFKRQEIECATDVVIWSVDEGDLIPIGRPQDKTFKGNVVQAVQAYQQGDLGAVPIPLGEVNRIIAIGSDRMMNAMRKARKECLKDCLKPDHTAVGSINTPMQCMMKQICAQCLQRHVDPQTGKESFVFSCFNQDQLLDEVDFDHLGQRLRQNSTAEKLTSLWLEHLFESRQMRTI